MKVCYNRYCTCEQLEGATIVNKGEQFRKVLDAFSEYQLLVGQSLMIAVSGSKDTQSQHRADKARARKYLYSIIDFSKVK